MTATEAVETSVTSINSLSQDFTNLDDQPSQTLSLLYYACDFSHVILVFEYILNISISIWFFLSFCLLYNCCSFKHCVVISQFHNGQYPQGNIDNKTLRPFYGTLFLIFYLGACEGMLGNARRRTIFATSWNWSKWKTRLSLLKFLIVNTGEHIWFSPIGRSIL